MGNGFPCFTFQWLEDEKAGGYRLFLYVVLFFSGDYGGFSDGLSVRFRLSLPFGPTCPVKLLEAYCFAS